ncbi:MAG: GNAT family N-acetyltransferase [Saprospiraceae bacterium]
MYLLKTMLEPFELIQGEYMISTDRNKLDLKMIHWFLSTQAYWSPGIPFEKVQRASERSLCFGIYYENIQIGYSRIISDYTSIAYLGDVFILKEFRGKGLSKWLMTTIRSHPDLQGLRRWILLTKDAHELYKRTGWSEIAQPDLWMEIHQKDIYER